MKMPSYSCKSAFQRWELDVVIKPAHGVHGHQSCLKFQANANRSPNATNNSIIHKTEAPTQVSSLVRLTTMKQAQRKRASHHARDSHVAIGVGG
jgi:murein tripeptide amidase MpaA